MVVKLEYFLKLDEVLNVYKIYRWDVAHCHPLHKPEHLCYLRSFREVNEVQGQLAVINSKARMSMRMSYKVMGQAWRHGESSFSVSGLKELSNDNSSEGDGGWCSNCNSRIL